MVHVPRAFGHIAGGIAVTEELCYLTWLKLVPKGWGGDGVDEGLDFRG